MNVIGFSGGHDDSHYLAPREYTWGNALCDHV